jgi:hydroxyethylthiazole kinase-like sugar kinase family protein
MLFYLHIGNDKSTCKDCPPPVAMMPHAQKSANQPQSLIDIVAPLDRTKMRAAHERVNKAHRPVTLMPVGLAAILRITD